MSNESAAGATKDVRNDIEKSTGAIYDHLFTAYSKEQFESSSALYLMRHKEWSLDLGFDPETWFKGKHCLDAGNGGGRFLVALARLGAGRVEGIDVSAEAVKAANARLKERNLDGVARSQVASVLNIPFPDATFDYVVSSGVILLTHDPKKAFTELVRVLRPGGKLFLSVYGKGGLKWFINDVFRYTICQLIPFTWMEKMWAAVGVPANKRYNMLDNLYTPYTKRFTEEEIRTWCKEAGLWNLRRVKFERYDYSTILSRIIHGEGWIQIYADKKTK